MAIFTIFILVLSSWCCAADHYVTWSFEAKAFCTRVGDKYLCGPLEKDPSWEKDNMCHSYGKGSVWMRPCVTRPGFDLYYRPEDTKPTPSGYHPCYVCHFSSDKKQWVEPFKDLFETVSAFFYSEENFFSVYVSQYYQIPTKDILCAAVTGIKESFSGECPYSGVEHPEFHSWARHIPWGENTLSGRMLDFSGHPDGRGDLWVRREKSGRCVLCYRAEYGPPWMYYRYDLSQEKGWPKRWLPELRDIKRFALSDKIFFDKDSCANVANLVAGVRMALVGQSGNFYGKELAVWKPVSEGSEVVRSSTKHRVVRGAVLGNTYQKGSAWIVILPTKYLFRARTKDDEIFQITHMRQPHDVEALNAHTPWVAQEIEFIFGACHKKPPSLS